MFHTQSPPSQAICAGQDADSIRVTIRFGTRTDIGRRRRNEDSFGAKFPLFLVADGMGGNRQGHLASSLAVEEMMMIADGVRFVAAQEIKEALARAAQRVHRLGAGYSAPGSTLTGLAISTHRGRPVARVFNIGDSRTYTLAGGKFQLLTRDHSRAQELIDTGRVSGVEARALPQQNVITRALGAGSGKHVVVDHYLVSLAAGDRFILCSDGLSGEVTDSLIEIVSRVVRDPQQLADELVTMALTAGGKDNITVVVVDIVEAQFSPVDTEQAKRGVQEDRGEHQ
ncbi:MAG: protein phosphatase 2C domain-containing protein [Ancrocorticia sp.]